MILEDRLDNTFFPGFMTLETIKIIIINFKIIFKIKVNIIDIKIDF